MDNVMFELPIEKLGADEEMYPNHNRYSVVDARYVKHGTIIDDPDLCALPIFSSREAADVSTIGLPGYDHADVKSMSVAERIESVLSLQKVFFPLAHIVEMSKAVKDALVSSYLSREVKINASHTALTSTRSGLGGRPLSFVVYGSSGCGKTVAINLIRKMYPSAIHHVLGNIEYTQIPIIAVTALVGNMSELLMSIARAIDDINGIGPVWEVKTRKNNLGKAAFVIKEAIRIYHIGLIIIDESQFLKFDSSNSSLENLIGIAEETGCALGFIGNRDLIPKMDRYPRFVNRTMLNRVEVSFKEKYSQNFFEEAARELWSYQWTKKYTELTPEIMDELIKASMYNISILKAVLMRIQSDAIAKFPQGGITPKYIRNISEKRFAVIRTLILDDSEDAERLVLKALDDNVSEIKSDAKRFETVARQRLLEERAELDKTWGAGRYEELQRLVSAFGIGLANLKKIIGKLLVQDPGLPKRDIAVVADEVKRYLDAHQTDVVKVGRKRKQEVDAEGVLLVDEVMKDALSDVVGGKV